MPAQRLDFNFHVGKERQAGQQIVELGGALNLENTNICVPTGDPPNMPPYPFGLQILAHRFFCCLQFFQANNIHIRWDINGHLNMK
jgi:hypothetical protein